MFNPVMVLLRAREPLALFGEDAGPLPKGMLALELKIEFLSGACSAAALTSSAEGIVVHDR